MNTFLFRAFDRRVSAQRRCENALNVGVKTPREVVS
jgi:hypothetical protein